MDNVGDPPGAGRGLATPSQAAPPSSGQPGKGPGAKGKGKTPAASLAKARREQVQNIRASVPPWIQSRSRPPLHRIWKTWQLARRRA